MRTFSPVNSHMAAVTVMVLHVQIENMPLRFAWQLRNYCFDHILSYLVWKRIKFPSRWHRCDVNRPTDSKVIACWMRKNGRYFACPALLLPTRNSFKLKIAWPVKIPNRNLYIIRHPWLCYYLNRIILFLTSFGKILQIVVYILESRQQIVLHMSSWHLDQVYTI
jgi:hypothetical protein